MASLQSKLDDPYYKQWLKGGLSIRLFQTGLVKFVDQTIKNLQSDFLSDISNHLSILEAKCTECTTANCLPCLPSPTKDICIVTVKGRNRHCSYHAIHDINKKYRPCPNGICEPSLRGKIQNQHQYNNPAWKNTDASKWCTMHWEMAKCYMPPGYGDKTSAAETDCSGLLHVIMNCQYVQKYMDRYIANPNGHFMQILNFRNKIVHSASQSLDQVELDRHIDLMIEILQDKKTLAQDPGAQNAVGLLTQLKSGTLNVSLKDESEIRAEHQAAYQARKLELQTSLCEIYDENFKTIPISPLLDEVEADIDDVVVDMIVCDDTHEGYVKNNSKPNLMSRIGAWSVVRTNNDRYDDSHDDERQGGDGLNDDSHDDDDDDDDLLDNCKLYQYAEENKMGKTINDYKGIFFRDNESCKNIYILGEAGMGKTTWCMKMLRTWVTALKKIKADTQNGTLSVNENVMSQFDIVLFVSLRYAVNDGNIRDMVRNQLFQERPNLNSLISEVLEKEANKCLVILDGFDEWSPPEDFISTSILQNSQIPGRKELNGCPVLTTTRSYKLHQVPLHERDADNKAIIQGLKDYKGFVKQVIDKRRREAGKKEQDDPVTYQAFCKEVKSSFKQSISQILFLRLPLILTFVLCSWLNNGKLEKTWAGNFSGVLECMILAAEKRKRRLYGFNGIDDLKKKWSKSKYKSFLPQIYQDKRTACTNYSLLILNISKMAFYTLFDANNENKLLFPEELVNKWLSTKEVEVAVKIGILSQIKVVGNTLTRTSSLSFLHKTIQEHLAAVHLCSKTDDQQNALQIFKDCCTSSQKVQEYEQILINVYGMNIQTASDVSNHIAIFVADDRNKFDFFAKEINIDNKFKLFVKEMNKAHDNLTLSSLTPLYVAKLSEISNNTWKLEITKTPLSFHIPVINMMESVSESLGNILDIEETQTWLPNPWSPSHWLLSPWRNIVKKIDNPWSQGPTSLSRNLEYIINLISNSGNNGKIKINLSHFENLESVSFIDISFCDIALSQTSLQEIIIKGASNCSIHINKTVESSEMQQPPLKVIKFKETNICTIALSNADWKIDNLEYHSCDSCQLVSKDLTEIKHCCLAGELQNIQSEKEDFKLSINYFILRNYNLQNMKKYFERYLPLYLWNVKVVTITEMPDTEDNWTTLIATFPYLHNMQKFSLSVKKLYYLHDKKPSHLSNIQYSALHSLQYAAKLKYLILNDPSEKICNALARALPNIIQLEKIEIVHKKDIFGMNCVSIRDVIESMKWLPFLTDITIRDDDCAPFETLALVLPHLQKLRKLDLNLSDWSCNSPHPTVEHMGLNLMTSIQHVESLREIHLTLTLVCEAVICFPPMPLLEKLCIKKGLILNEKELPEKLLSSISNLPNLRQLHLVGVGEEKNLEQLYQVLPILTNLKILELNFSSVRLDIQKYIASLPNTNGTIEVRLASLHINEYRDKIQDAITESRRFTLQHNHFNTNSNSGSYCLLPISNEESTEVNLFLNSVWPLPKARSK